MAVSEGIEMSERTLIELLYGQGAHANTLACVEDVPFDLVGRRIDSFPHSIWQLVWHMNYWTVHDLKRVRRENPPYPAHASESWPANAAPPSEEEWRKEVAQFRNLLVELSTLAASSPDVLAEEVPATHPTHTQRSSSLEAVLWQILVHNSYHIGQVAVLRRAFNAWPPKAGADTW
jgi:uncharacterized damage-inducible protein DinB